MTTTGKKRARTQPLLNTIARQIGGAAGNLTKTAKGLVESLAFIPKAVTKAPEGKAPDSVWKPPRAVARHAKKRARRVARPSTPPRPSAATPALTANNRKPARRKASARRRK